MSLQPLSSVYDTVYKMYQADRRIYHQMYELQDQGLDVYLEFKSIEEKHLAQLKKIVKEHRWPGIKLLGEEGAHMMWILVQHCDTDVNFQERCRQLLEQAVSEGNATHQQLAFLTDRVLRNLKEKQIFGTQIQLIEGKLALYPLENPEKLDEYRQNMGLGPFTEYIALFQQFYPDAKIER